MRFIDFAEHCLVSILEKWRWRSLHQSGEACLKCHCDTFDTDRCMNSLRVTIFFFSSRYTSPVQCWTHALAWSFRASKSSKVHGSGRRGQIRRCSIVCSSPQSQVASPSSYPHLCMRDLHLPVAVLRRLRHSQKGHASLEPDGRDSLGSRVSLCGAFWRCADQRAILRLWGASLERFNQL